MQSSWVLHQGFFVANLMIIVIRDFGQKVPAVNTSFISPLFFMCALAL
jgi:hypothetical protein